MAARSRNAAPGCASRSTASPPLRADGIPLVGYTWFPFTALIDWAYRESTTPIDDWLVQMGMVDLIRFPGGGTLERHPTAAHRRLPRGHRPRHAPDRPLASLRSRRSRLSHDIATRGFRIEVGR